tara:strand:+ start:1055 stop:1411 length:357 start_codon:yes stop_codon:yes gene_type:complete
MAAVGNNQKTDVTYRIFHDDDAEAQDNVAGGSCSVYTLFIYNAWGTQVWLKLYDAVDPVYGTTAPSHIFRIAPNTREVFSWPTGLAFSSGLSYTVTTVNSTLCPAFAGTANVMRIITS